MSDNLQNQSIQLADHAPIGRPSFPFFALIIGIDAYTHWPRLGGAVGDAQAMEKYLIDVLQVSKENIITLYDEGANRDAIIAAFRQLQNNNRIHHGDPIVIFYAGHGGELPARTKWNAAAGKIQCLVPQNCGPPRSETCEKDAPIPDVVIGTLIKDIAGVKGDNISVIFDCCHSSSAARSDEDEYIPRGVYLDLKIPYKLDDDILQGRPGTITDSYAYSGVRSHILLAACAANEFAYEGKNSKRGQFTLALLDTLRKCSVNLLTYTEVINQVQFKNQHPQCVGFRQNRALFNARVPNGTQVFHQVVQKGGKYVINAGLAHGVSHGVEFTLYDDQKHKVDIVVVDETFTIGDFETTATKPPPHAAISFAKLSHVGKLPLYLEDQAAARHILYSGRAAQYFDLVGDEEANLEIAMECNQAVFRILDERVRRFGLTKLPHEASANTIAHVLALAARYYRYLCLTEARDRIDAKQNVSVDFYRLEVEHDEFWQASIHTVEPGLCKKDPNLDNSDVIDFIVDEDAMYGVKITNNTSMDLYLNVFLFNNSDMSIVPCYTQSNAGSPEVPLPQRGGIFTIGYGTGGTPPLSYALPEQLDVDVSYLKIFFATQPIDMSYIVQPSPFSGMDGRAGIDESGREREGKLKKFAMAILTAVRWSHQDRWFTLSIPIVQRRKATV